CSSRSTRRRSSASPAQAALRNPPLSAPARSRAARKIDLARWGSSVMAFSGIRTALQCDACRRFVSEKGKSGLRRLVVQGTAEPGASVVPVAVALGPGDRQSIGGFLDREAGVEAQLDECRRRRIFRAQRGQGVVQNEQVFGGALDGGQSAEGNPAAT